MVYGWPHRHPDSRRAPHTAESQKFCAAFPDNKVLHPYPVLFGEGDFTCFVADFTGTFTGRLETLS